MPGLDEPSEDDDDARPKARHALRVLSILSLPRTPAMRRARSQPGKDGRGLFCEPSSLPTSNVLCYFIHLLSCQSKIPTYSDFVVALLMSLYLLAHQLRFD